MKLNWLIYLLYPISSLLIQCTSNDTSTVSNQNTNFWGSLQGLLDVEIDPILADTASSHPSPELNNEHKSNYSSKRGRKSQKVLTKEEQKKVEVRNAIRRQKYQNRKMNDPEGYSKFLIVQKNRVMKHLNKKSEEDKKASRSRISQNRRESYKMKKNNGTLAKQPNYRFGVAERIKNGTATESERMKWYNYLRRKKELYHERKKRER